MSQPFISRLPHLHPLYRCGVTDATYTAYRRAVDHFLHDCNLDYLYLRRLTANSIDQRFAAWIEGQYNRHGTRAIQRSENARNGLHIFFPKTRRQLTRADVALRSWRRQKNTVSYPPIPRNVATLLAARLARRGQLHAALAVLLSFDCYLRINECLQLRRSDIRIPVDHRLGEPYQHCALFLRKTKTGKNLSVEVYDPAIARLLHRCFLSLPHADSRLFSFSEAAFRESHVKGTLDQMGLSHLHFVPHSFRHGGATHDFVIRRRSAEYVRNRGRWRSQQSADRYMQQLAAVDLTFTIPADVDQLGATFWSQLEVVMDSAADDAGWSKLPPLPESLSAGRR